MKKIIELKIEETKAVAGGIKIAVPVAASGVSSAAPVVAQRR
jgi:hypothetical protein